MKPLLLISLILFGSCAAAPVPNNRARVVAHVLHSLIRLTHKVDEEHTYVCTGFIVDAARGYAVTAKHCVLDENDEVLPEVAVNGAIQSDVIKTDDELALLRIPAMMGPPLELRTDKPDLGEEVVAIGYGFGDLVVAIRHVAIADKDFEDDSAHNVLFDGPLVPGMSGGPIVDLDGKLVAVTQGNSPLNLIARGTTAKEVKKFVYGK